MSSSTESAAGADIADSVSHVALYRQDFRRYLRALDRADEWRSAAFNSAADGLAHDAQVMARLNADGWNRYGWPPS